MYDPNDLSRKIREIVVTLKEKVYVKLPRLHIPDYVKDKYSLALNFHPHKFPPLPTSKMALASAPPFQQWGICGDFLKVHKNECLKPAQRLTPIKHDIYSFNGHLHVDIKHVKVETPIHEDEERKRSRFHPFKY